MSRVGKTSLFVGALMLVTALILRMMTGMWINLTVVLLAISAGLFVLSVSWDWRLYWEFLTMRTTKHGMNMGAMILMVLTVLVCLNYLANKSNKIWDLTKEKQFSLSDQSNQLLKNLSDEMTIKVFYKGQENPEERARIKTLLGMYRDYSKKLHVEFINAYVDQAQAHKYLNDIPDLEGVSSVTFVEFGGKKVRVDYPYAEAEFTSAMIKATRKDESKIYFLKGHGERDLLMTEAPGMKAFADALAEASFKVEALSLIDSKGVPADAAVIAIVGPSVPYLEEELKWLREYVEKGGKLFIALDPGVRHNLAGLAKTLGVQFENNFVLTQETIQGGGPATVLGRGFDQGSDITKSLPHEAPAVFNLASEIHPASDRDEKIEVAEIVKSSPLSYPVLDPTKPLDKMPDMKPVTLGVEVKGKAAIFGDSDFASNRLFELGVNRNLALNSIASLANQKDLLSIKPKRPAGTNLVLTSYGRLALIALGLGLPLLLLLSSAVIWYRRRGA